MRVHDNRFGTVRHFVTLRPTPPRVFVILRVLHFLEKAAPGPNVLAEAAAGHAEKMLPPRRLAFRPEAPLIIVGVDGAAIWTRNLFAECSRRLPIFERTYQRPEPVAALGCGVGVEEDAEFGARECH